MLFFYNTENVIFNMEGATAKEINLYVHQSAPNYQQADKVAHIPRHFF